MIFACARARGFVMPHEMSLADDYNEAAVVVDTYDSNEPWLTIGPKDTGPWSQAYFGMRLADVRRLIDAWDRKQAPTHDSRCTDDPLACTREEWIDAHARDYWDAMPESRRRELAGRLWDENRRLAAVRASGGE